ncbi:hypothetical protein [Alienimonas chondri]|uniref:Uncharacterized protein n=1 Tax=Alienimonas chondri TaxID=2681879 RepID=A0ABX1VHW4_9PLAN|nr:hypothetical protein [Alienimonas chondri]NNJ27714.1 hypothetical protein [Alienimonas chondri]
MTAAPFLRASLLAATVVAFAPPAFSQDAPLTGVAAERAAEEALETKLDAPPPADLNLEDGDFMQTVTALAEAAEAPLTFDRSAFYGTDPLKVAFTRPPAAVLQQAPTLRAAFDAVLHAQGGPPMALVNRAGLLRVTTAEVAAANLRPRVYDVRGLEVALGLTEEDRVGTVVERVAGRGAGGEPKQFDPPLIHALKVGVGPAPGVAKWDTDGGPAAIAGLGGRLVIRQSPGGHAALARLLAELQATADEVTNETAANRREPAGEPSE